MNSNNIFGILNLFFPKVNDFSFHKYGKGLINDTFLIVDNLTKEKYILQKINTQIFSNPEIISNNITLAATHLKQNYPLYPFLTFLPSSEGLGFATDHQDGVWRLMQFVPHSFSYEAVTNVEQAHSTAYEFARLTTLLADAPIAQFQPAIPHFHDLSLRFAQFNAALLLPHSPRKEKAKQLIDFLLSQSEIVQIYQNICQNDLLPLRIVHADTKINNILFAENTQKFACIVDLDTLMPGYIISDLGDMMRTMLCEATENETDKANIIVRKDFYHAICEGYAQGMGNNLTEAEKAHFFYAGKFMIYMQALRFLTDYLQNDTYYKIAYPEHNFDRAQNQIWLLQAYLKLS